MKKLYTASLLTSALMLGGCSYNAVQQSPEAKRMEAPQTITCTPLDGLVDEKGFACKDAVGVNIRVVPDRGITGKLKVWQDSPYEAARPKIDEYAKSGTAIKVSGKWDLKDNEFEAIRLEIGDLEFYLYQ